MAIFSWGEGRNKLQTEEEEEDKEGDKHA